MDFFTVMPSDPETSVLLSVYEIKDQKIEDTLNMG
jgi:hypothetical protein